MANQLDHLIEFEEVLRSYQISDESKRELAKDKLVLLTAPTSIGRNTIIKSLVNSGKYYFVLSDTTREPRISDGAMEQSGEIYWFKTEVEILEGLKQGKYLEAAIIHTQQVSGMRVDEIKKAAAQNKIAIKDVEIQGVESYMKAKPDTIAIFVLPPSFDEWMRRLKHRGPMSDQEFSRRLNSAIAEFDYGLKSDLFTFVINDDFKRASQEINELVKTNKVDIEDQEKCRELAASLRQIAIDMKKTI